MSVLRARYRRQRTTGHDVGGGKKKRRHAAPPVQVASQRAAPSASYVARSVVLDSTVKVDDAELVEAVAVAARFHWRDVEVLAAYGGDQGLDLSVRRY